MSDNSGLDQIIQDQIGQYFSNPSGFPQEFLDWLPQYLTVNAPQLQNSQLAGGTLTPADGAPHSIVFGTGTLSFAASQNASAVISHALGEVPTVVVANATGGEADCDIGIGTVTASTITFDGWLPAAATKAVTFDWIAIA